MIVRPATAADIAHYADTIPTPTVRAVVGEIDGRLVGIGGLRLLRGRWYAFVDLLPEARVHKMTIMRTAKRLLEQARHDGIRFIYAERSPVESRAGRWLASLGFELDQRSMHYYRWSA